MQRFLTDADYASAALALLCKVNAIKAFATIEAPRGFFNADGTPVILYERHYFHRLTGGRFDKSHPELSNRKRGGYGLYAEQHPKLAAAVKLDRNAALQSASWGGFQIMGANFKRAGFATLQDFINAMFAGAPQHLGAFVQFIRSDPSLLRALRAEDWHLCAELYNGSAQDAPPGVIHDYDFRIAQEFDRLESGA